MPRRVSDSEVRSLSDSEIPKAHREAVGPEGDAVRVTARHSLDDSREGCQRPRRERSLASVMPRRVSDSEIAVGPEGYSLDDSREGRQFSVRSASLAGGGAAMITDGHANWMKSTQKSLYKSQYKKD